MTLINLDPEELQQTAALLRGVSSEIAELATALPGICCCEMPAGVLARVDAELGAAQGSVGEAAQGYGWAADDAATRGGLMAGDQALTGAMSSAYGGGTSDWLAPMSSGAAPVADAGWSPNYNDWLSPMTTESPGSSAGFTGGFGGTAGWGDPMTSGAGSNGFGGTTAGWGGNMDTPVLTSDAGWHYVPPPAVSADAATLAGLLGGGGTSGLTGSSIVTNTGNLAATTLAPNGITAIASPTGMSIGYGDGAGRVGTIADVYPIPGGFGNQVIPH